LLLLNRKRSCRIRPTLFLRCDLDNWPIPMGIEDLESTILLALEGLLCPETMVGPGIELIEDAPDDQVCQPENREAAPGAIRPLGA
jgi:hypothetical protein